MIKLQKKVTEYHVSVQDSMTEIENQVALVKLIEEGDYHINVDLSKYENIFELLELELSQPCISDQLPSWYPENGLIFNEMENFTDEEILA